MSSVANRMKRLCPELDRLPNGWSFIVTKDNENRVYFLKDSTGETTFNHPALGGLPAPWILRISTDPGGSWSVTYYNRDTGTMTTEDPRYMATALELHSECVSESLRIAARTTKTTPSIDLNNMQRAPIQNKNIRDQFEVVHAIDPGDGTKGGMNGGVFVVRMKGLPNRLFVEKRFKENNIEFAQKEIRMLHRLKHWALTFYTAAFITPDLKAASVYVEFCDRGSMEELIKSFSSKSPNSVLKPELPESFIWHAFTGLCDGLAYLLGGRSFLGKSDIMPDRAWAAILHRDIKPDNILLRSRATLGSERYFYCVLSDFGLACPESGDEYQKSGVKLGTKPYWAPELCYEPYPKTLPYPRGDDQWKMFPGQNKHSRYSDVWALGACIYNLCACEVAKSSLSHIDLTRKPFNMAIDEYFEGTLSRRNPLAIPYRYSLQLLDAVLLSTKWNPNDRPDAISLIRNLEVLMIESGFTVQNSREKLPGWATNIHGYHSKR